MRHCTLPALLTCAFIAAVPLLGHAATLPSPPLTLLDTTYAPPSGNTITVNAGGNLQAALNSAQLGDTIVLQAGATFTGPFTLPNKTTGNGWIYIRSSALSSLPPPGTRVTPADAANMPKIVVGDQVGGAIQTANGAHHYRFVGIEFKPVTGKFVFALIDIGGATSVLANMPTDITFDRCYIHGDPTVGGRRGVAMNGARVAVIDSHVSDFKEVGADTQALWTYNSPGPLKIVNNYLEASGENFMSGGAEPVITNLVPSDIEIRRNHFFKPLAWLNEPWLVKNLFELKNAQRVLIEGNVFENSWPAGQNGFAFLITPRNENGTAPWSATRDITVRYNKLINVAQGMNFSGRDTNFGGNASQETQRVLVEHNLIVVTRLKNADGRIFGIINGPVDLTIRHNTGLITVSEGTTAFSENAPFKADLFDFRDNLLSAGLYGFLGSGFGPGFPTLNAYYSNYTFLKNALIGACCDAPSVYPGGNFFPPDIAVVGFTDYAGGNYRLAPTSPYIGAGSDGKDLGANINAIEAAIAGISTPTLPVTVSVARVGSGTGSVSSLPAGVNCGSLCTVQFESGSFIALTANAASGSVFTGWSGACTGTGTCYITVSQPSSVTATFDVPSPSTPRLANLATRMPVLTGDRVLIGGFTIGGTAPKNVVVRARGPSLAAQGVTGVLANPILQLFSGATVIAANDDWQVGPSAGAVQASGLAPSNPQESALYATLTPGAYTAVIAGVGGTTGVGLVEVFEVDQPGSPQTNISTRGQVLTGNNVLIGGFIVTGSSPLTVVVRARGPSLAQAGLTGVLGNPVLQLFSGATSIAVNDDWQLASNASAIQQSGFAPSNPLESAILITLNPGPYTAVVSGTGASTGLAIVEVFAQ